MLLRSAHRLLADDVHTAVTPSWGDWKADDSAGFARTFAAKSYYGGEASRAGESLLMTCPDVIR